MKIKCHEVIPSACKIGPIAHHLLAQFNFLRLISLLGIERLAVYEVDLVAVEDTGPAGPWVWYWAVRVEVHVYIRVGLSIAVRELVDVANEMMIADHLIQGLTVLDRVVWVCPILFRIIRTIIIRQQTTNQSRYNTFLRDFYHSLWILNHPQ